MDNQKDKRGSSEGRDTKNLSELLEFDFNSMNNDEASAENEQGAQAKQGDEYLDSFFDNDMGLPPLPESEEAKGTNLTMSSAFSKVQEANKEQSTKSPEQAKKTTKQVENKTKTKKVKAKNMPVPEDVLEPEAPKRRFWNIVKGVFVWCKEIVVALVLVWLLLTFVAQNSTVIGDSMLPTLEGGDMIVVNKFIYRFTDPLRGDVIVFDHVDPLKGEEMLIKRIIGMPGDTVEIIDGTVYINGMPYDESKYLAIPTEVMGDMDGPFVVPEDSYFVMGDNRVNSKDSRYDEVGAVSREQIVGKASLRFWPLEKISVIQ
jgi:signal peptidase I